MQCPNGIEDEKLLGIWVASSEKVDRYEQRSIRGISIVNEVVGRRD